MAQRTLKDLRNMEPEEDSMATEILDTIDTSTEESKGYNPPNTDDIENAVKAEMDGLHTRFRHLSYVNREGEIVEKVETKLTFYVGSLERDAEFANNGLSAAQRAHNRATRAEMRPGGANPDADTIDGRAVINTEENLHRAEQEFNEAEDAAHFGKAYFADLLGFDWSPTPRTQRERAVEFTTPEVYAAMHGLDVKTVERQARRSHLQAANKRA